MENKNITVILNIDDGRILKDIEIPSTIGEFNNLKIIGNIYNLGMNTDDISSCYLRSENPVSLLRGTRNISDFGLHNASVIYFKQRRNFND